MSGMSAYFLRRFLLVPITFFVITFLVYAVLRVVPGGPIEQAEAASKLKAMGGEGGSHGGGIGQETGLQLDESSMRELERYYALDRSIPVGYLQWLGVWPREVRHRVPPVDPHVHADALARLGAADAAVEKARAALAASLDPAGLAEARGRIGRPVEPDALPDDVQKETEDLFETTFGERPELSAFLVSKGYVLDVRHETDEEGEDQEVRRVLEVVPESGWPEGTKALLAALVDARAEAAKAEAETGYYLDLTQKPLAVPFRVLRDLQDVRSEADRRIGDRLDAEGFIVYRGDLYRPAGKDERARPENAAFFTRADELVEKGFGKRDELLAYLEKRGFTWRGGVYFERVDDAWREAHPEVMRVVESLLATRRAANDEIARLADRYGYDMTEDGILYRVDYRLSGIFELDFGQSYTYNEPVLSLIGSRMEVSVQFGLIGYFLTWIVCVPLGVLKAIKHRTVIDAMTSFVVFLGYAIPGFVLCLILLSQVAVHVDWLPLGGYKPSNIDQLGWWDSFVGRVRHMLIPVAGYMVGSFATMTILMKNSLLENLGKDYVRTAFAKGLPERRVIFVHALRNSLIPITSGVGYALSLLFAGAFLIEKTCNIDGMGLLGYNALIQRDYPIILGELVFLELILLTGNIISDLVWAFIDPRIRFG